MSYKMNEMEDGTPTLDISERKFDLANKAAHVEEVGTDSEGQYELDPVIDKRVTRKFDVHIVPWLFGIW
jgi:hypothetical protein